MNKEDEINSKCLHLLRLIYLMHNLTHSVFTYRRTEMQYAYLNSI